MADKPSPALAHRAHPEHPHQHDRFCGHPVLPHEDHVDFLHDGHVHHPHEDHVDDVREPADAPHLAHAGHMHVHGPGCGHPTVRHADHDDYVHGIHRHAGHDVHYDEH